MTLLVRNPALRCILKLLEFMPQSRGVVGPIRRILLSNLAHLGDVVIASSVITPLREAFPGVEIGFLCGSWAVDLLDVDYVHTIDHYKHDRGSPSVWRYLREKRSLVSELQEIDYDVAIDLYYYFGNAAHIFAKAKIPVRIGYTSGGLGSYYTHPVCWSDCGHHVCEYYPRLLSCIGLKVEGLRGAVPDVEKMDRGYTVLHPGSGDRRKSWGGWSALVRAIKGEHKLCVTGQGEAHLTDPLAALGAHNFADRLTMHEWIGVIGGARLVIAIDSAIVHIAAALNVPCIAIYSTDQIAREWGGHSKVCHKLVQPTVQEVKILALQRSTQICGQ